MSRVIHFEIPADDPQRALDFYQQVFGWKIEKWQGPVDYWLITTGEKDKPGIDGAIMQRANEGDGVENTVGVDSVDAALENIEARGGKILRGKQAVPGVGWMAYCQDTEGNTFGMMEEDPNAA
jgi:uncharacterized protein